MTFEARRAITADHPSLPGHFPDAPLAEYLKEYPPPVFSERLYQSIELLERYSVDMAIDLARRLNVIDHLGQWRSVDDLCRLLSFQPSFQFALHWILERLAEIDC